MTVSKQQILATLATLEASAPLDFGNMPVADDRVRDIFATSMAGMSASDAFRCATPHCREEALLASLTHALLDAAQLRHQLLASAGRAKAEAYRLLAKVSTI
jgi:hypothetical protein